MISSYEIKKVKGEEILYLYFDLSNEFSKDCFKNKNDEITNVIKKFIKENKIAFKGTIATIIIGGTIVGNIALNNDINHDPSINDNTLYEDKVEVVNNDIILEESVINEKNDTESNKEEIGEKEKNSDDKVINNVKQEKEINVIEEAKIEEPEDTNIYIKMRRSSGEVVSIELEEYIIGVVSAEMPAAFHEQALMAQSILARTYALKAISKGQILTDNESTQSYKDQNQLRSIWGSSYDLYYNKVKNAVETTKGMYLSYNGSYIEAVYHSTSNGYTEDASNVWGNYFPYLVSVESKYDNLNPSFKQTKSISYEELSSKLSTNINIETEFNILSKTSGNRVESIEINNTIYKGTELRKILGLRSADFDIEKTDNEIIFTTRGYGHGVGMSQYGANGMAKAGYSYSEILYHYYPGVSINYL